MYLNYCFRVVGEVNTDLLWENIKGEGVNLTNTGKGIWVYGSSPMPILGRVLVECCKVGHLEGHLTKGR